MDGRGDGGRDVRGMTGEDLRASILQLAFQGKLVPQEKTDESAQDLLKRIRSKKKSLIAEKKVPNDKKMPAVSEDEQLFDIPESWVWTRIGELFQHNTGKALNGSNKEGTLLPYITTSNLYWNRFELDRLKEMPFTDAEMDKCTAKKGDLLVCEGGDYGRAAIWNYDYDIRIQNHIHRLRAYEPLCTEYFYYLFYFLKITGQIKGKGIAIQGLSSGALHNLPAPLPPLAEQRRIVAKIEELVPLVEQYTAKSEKLNALNASFPEMMKKSILQEAVQGRLVPQDPNDEPASVLLKKIAEEKKRLVREGKIKKQKPLPEITEEEEPFEVPDGWEWAHVGDIFDHNTGKAMNSSAKQINKKGAVRKFITTSNLYWNSFDLSSVKEMFFSDDELARCTATKRDILMCEGGAYYGRTAIWDYDFDICFQNHIHRLRPYTRVSEEYFYYLFYFYRMTGMMKSKGTAMPGLSSVTLHEFLVPLPPLEEQKRIVSKIEELMPVVFNKS